jgi:hypothetical protein
MREAFDDRVAMNDTRSGCWEGGVAGVFGYAKDAFRAIHALREAGFMRAWIGFFERASDNGPYAALDAEWEGDPSEAHGVFPMREGQGRTLVDVLRSRGVPAATAYHLARTVPAPTIIVVVDAPERSARAVSLLTTHGARRAGNPGNGNTTEAAIPPEGDERT